MSRQAEQPTELSLGLNLKLKAVLISVHSHAAQHPGHRSRDKLRLLIAHSTRLGGFYGLPPLANVQFASLKALWPVVTARSL
jgi:hypothetical protein